MRHHVGAVGQRSVVLVKPIEMVGSQLAGGFSVARVQQQRQQLQLQRQMVRHRGELRGDFDGQLSIHLGQMPRRIA